MKMPWSAVGNDLTAGEQHSIEKVVGLLNTLDMADTSELQDMLSQVEVEIATRDSENALMPVLKQLANLILSVASSRGEPLNPTYSVLYGNGVDENATMIY